MLNTNWPGVPMRGRIFCYYTGEGRNDRTIKMINDLSKKLLKFPFRNIWRYLNKFIRIKLLNSHFNWKITCIRIEFICQPLPTLQNKQTIARVGLVLAVPREAPTWRTTKRTIPQRLTEKDKLDPKLIERNKRNTRQRMPVLTETPRLSLSSRPSGQLDSFVEGKMWRPSGTMSQLLIEHLWNLRLTS